MSIYPTVYTTDCRFNTARTFEVRSHGHGVRLVIKQEGGEQRSVFLDADQLADLRDMLTPAQQMPDSARVEVLKRELADAHAALRAIRAIVG